jgi:hypothetical protein
LGAGLAQILSRGLVSFISKTSNPLFVRLDPDWQVLGFTAALAVLTCMLFGVVPAMRATQLSPAYAIRAGGRSVTAGPERFSLRRILVATQVALSLVLLVGALLFIRSLHNLLSTDPGFQAEGVVTVALDFSKAQYPKERRPALYRELHTRLSSIPGVVSAAQVSIPPVGGGGWNNDVGPDGAPAEASGKLSFFNRIAPGYFRTMGTNLIGGRDFDQRDTLGSPKVAIVNQEFARKFFAGANPVGRTFRYAAEAG